MGRMKELFEEAMEAERQSRIPVLSPFQAQEKGYLWTVASKGFDPEMSDREMLQWLQAELYCNPWRYGFFTVYGGLKGDRLQGYIAGVLGGYAMRVEPRVRAVLMKLHNGERLADWTFPPPGPVEYHPGRPPPHKRRRAARAAKAVAAAKAASGTEVAEATT